MLGVWYLGGWANHAAFVAILESDPEEIHSISGGQIAASLTESRAKGTVFKGAKRFEGAHMSEGLGHVRSQGLEAWRMEVQKSQRLDESLSGLPEGGNH